MWNVCKCFSLLYDLSILEKILNVFSFFSLNIANFELLSYRQYVLDIEQSAQHMKAEY